METGYRISASKHEYNDETVQTQEEAVAVATRFIREGYVSVIITDLEHNNAGDIW